MPEKKVNYNIELEDYLKQIGDRITELRKETGLAQDKFAFQHDMDRSLYQQMEKGKSITMTTFHRFLRAIDKSPKEFFSKGFE